MDWTLALLLVALAVLLAGAVQAAWHGRGNQAPPLVIPRREDLRGRLCYVDQLLDDCLARARRRLHLIEWVDERLKKRASSLACTAKR